MIWDQLTHAHFRELDRAIPVILPIAATEQHGDHLPLATDRMIGWHFLMVLNQRIEDKVLILPPVGVGFSQHHMDFSGSLTVSHAAMMSYISGIIESVKHHGFQNVLIFNSHGGNQALAQVVIEQLGASFPGNLLATSWWQLARDALLAETQTGPGGVGHAGEFETSLMLTIAPSLVRLDQASGPQNVPTFGWAENDLLRGAPASLYRSMAEITPNGVMGDPRESSADQGERITTLVVDRLAQIIVDLWQSSVD